MTSVKDWIVLILVGLPLAAAFWTFWIALLIYCWHLIIGGPDE